MSQTLQALKDAATSLPVRDRAELAQFLLRTLHESDEQDEQQVRAAWLDLAERRMADVRAGRVVGVPAEEVLKTLLGPGR